jgi:hypothetical protein
MEVTGKLHASAASPRRKSPWYPLNRRLGRPQSRSESCGVEKNFLPLLGITFYKIFLNKVTYISRIPD